MKYYFVLHLVLHHHLETFVCWISVIYIAVKIMQWEFHICYARLPCPPPHQWVITGYGRATNINEESPASSTPPLTTRQIWLMKNETKMVQVVGINLHMKPSCSLFSETPLPFPPVYCSSEKCHSQCLCKQTSSAFLPLKFQWPPKCT